MQSAADENLSASLSFCLAYPRLNMVRDTQDDGEYFLTRRDTASPIHSSTTRPKGKLSTYLILNKEALGHASDWIAKVFVRCEDIQIAGSAVSDLRCDIPSVLSIFFSSVKSMHDVCLLRKP